MNMQVGGGVVPVGSLVSQEVGRVSLFVVFIMVEYHCE